MNKKVATVAGGEILSREGNSKACTSIWNQYFFELWDLSSALISSFCFFPSETLLNLIVTLSVRFPEERTFGGKMVYETTSQLTAI
ncbi:hypothetical protein KFK09_007569 [Dendrobium nobile]|uniref:Uncharacterized protein n=1 Tax=Dendrobium nobile TaxID=94219 RepID=A0A8T3BWV9_DENNO|nr:hypothetical protein KFK09_007569 [Dendrobium nobile]